MNPYSDYQNIQDKKMFIKYELIDRQTRTAGNLFLDHKSSHRLLNKTGGSFK